MSDSHGVLPTYGFSNKALKGLEGARILFSQLALSYIRVFPTINPVRGIKTVG